MMKFIIYEDDKERADSVHKLINCILMNYEYDYVINKYSSFNAKLEKEIKEPNLQKIYILDIEVPGVNGVELASRIREYDWNSKIIFLTSYSKYKDDVLSSRIMPLCYIEKGENEKEELRKTILTCLNVIDNDDILCYKFNYAIYRIPIKEILYVEKIPFNKKCNIITTGSNKQEIGGNLADVLALLGKRFHQSHKSVIVNVTNIRQLDTMNNEILFHTGERVPLISTRYKKDFEEYVRNYK